MPPAAARPSARYRSVIVLFLLAFVLLGFFALGRLPVDSPPSRDAPRLDIRVTAPGLSAPQVEQELLRPLEDALAGLPEVAAMASSAAADGATVELRLKHGGDPETVQRVVAERVERVRSSWPASLDAPVLAPVDRASVAMEFTLISTTHDPLALRDWVEAEFAKRLRELRGVAAVEVRGGRVREILVMPDQRRLAGNGLSFEDVLRAIRQNPEADARAIHVPVRKRSRREPLLSGSLAAIAAIPVALPDGESVRLSEVAALVLNEPDNPEAVRLDGAEAVRVTVHRQASAALSDVVEQVRAHVDWMRANRLIPESIGIQTDATRFDQARKPLRKIAYALVAGLVLALTAAHLLWGRRRRTLILGMITVAAMQGAFMVMALSRMTLDVLTLGALALGVGLFGGSVALMFEARTPPARAGGRAVNPVIASAVFLAAALLPVWLAGGELGTFYRGFVAVFAVAWLLAALLAWWLVPIFDTRRREDRARWGAAVDRATARLRQAHAALVQRLLRRPAAWLAAALVVVAAAAVLAMSPVTAAPDDSGGNEIVLRLQGPDSDALAAQADAVVQRLRSLPGIKSIAHSAQESREQLLLRLDEERAAAAGVDLAAAARALAIATSGVAAGSFREAEHRYNVRLRLPPEDSASVAAGKILLLGELEHRPAVHLRDVATLERAVMPLELRHHDGKPAIDIAVLGADASAPAEIIANVQAALGEIGLPPGHELDIVRPVPAAEQSRALPALGMALALILASAAWLYRALRPALVLTISATFTLLVAAAALLFAGVPCSPPVSLGALLLLGLSAGHAAILVSWCEASAPESPLPTRLKQAARQQSGVMIALVPLAILGMLFLIWVNGSVSVLHILVIVLITGLVTSSLMNLLLTPLLYWLISRKEQTHP